MTQNLALEEIHDKIKQRMTFYVQSLNSNDIENLLSLWSSDGILIAPSIFVEGHDQIKKMYEKHIPQIIKGEITSIQINQIDDQIYEMGTNLEVREIDGNKIETKGNYVAIWTKNEGKWYISKLILPPAPI